MTTTEIACTVGDDAPDLTLTMSDGSSRQLASLWADRPVSLVFFRPLDSGGCVDNALQLRAASENMAKAGGEFIAVCVATPDEAAALSEKWKLPYQLLCTDENSYERYAVSPEEPGSFVIGQDGVIHFTHRSSGPMDNPSTWSFIDVVCVLTGNRVQRPETSSPSEGESEGVAPDAPVVPKPGNASTLDFTCAKCSYNDCEVLDVSTSSGMMSRMMNFQNRRFSAVTCRRCSFTEFYKTDSGKLRHMLDLVAGS